MKSSKQFDIMEIIDELRDYQQTAIMLNIEINPIMQYQAFYEQHKAINGSYRALKSPEYSEKMQERYNWIFCQINETIESKLNYEKGGFC